MNRLESRDYLQVYGILKGVGVEILRAIKTKQTISNDRFTALVDEHGISVYRFCRSLTYSKEDADDLFQETFLKAFEQQSKVNMSDNPQGFLFSTSLYIWKSWKRKYARRKTGTH